MPETSLYFQGKRVRKTQPASGFDVACKWKRNYGAWKVEEAWFILTDLQRVAGSDRCLQATDGH
ncbi:hypothetical protein [Microcoleus sp. BROC3]|uniref:hypothetical protein n=1 Tax=Microcoleus sp. BROC3 TaxID=3055323 RepID=UPI002FD43135